VVGRDNTRDQRSPWLIRKEVRFRHRLSKGRDGGGDVPFS